MCRTFSHVKAFPFAVPSFLFLLGVEVGRGGLWIFTRFFSPFSQVFLQRLHTQKPDLAKFCLHYLLTLIHFFLHSHVICSSMFPYRNRTIITSIYLSSIACRLSNPSISDDMPSVSWRPRKANGVIQSESKSLRTGRADGVTPCSKEEKVT